MRIIPTALAGTTRKVLTTAALAAAVAGMSMAAGGTAGATTLQDTSCTAAVSGSIGDGVVLDGATVQGQVRTAAKEARNFWSLLTVWPDHLAKEIAKERLAVGKVPDAPTRAVSGETIGTAVRKALEDEQGTGLTQDTKTRVLNHIRDKVAGTCGFTVRAANYVAPTSPGGSRPEGSPASPRAGVPSAGIAPRRDYSGIPSATPPGAGGVGLAVPPDLRYAPPGGTPGQAPEFGVLGADGSAGSANPDGRPDVRNAGNADSLAAPADPNGVQLPMLLAVVALAGVTAALVRTWVLRRVS